MTIEHRTTVDIIFRLPQGIRQMRVDLAVAEEAATLLQRFVLPQDQDGGAKEFEGYASRLMLKSEKCKGVSH